MYHFPFYGIVLIRCISVHLDSSGRNADNDVLEGLIEVRVELHRRFYRHDEL